MNKNSFELVLTSKMLQEFSDYCVDNYHMFNRSEISYNTRNSTGQENEDVKETYGSNYVPISSNFF